MRGKNKTTGAFSPVYIYIDKYIFSEKVEHICCVNKISKEAFLLSHFSEMVYSKTIPARIQTVSKLLRDTKNVLAACLLLDFPENQWLETGTKFLVSVQRVPSDNLQLF